MEHKCHQMILFLNKNIAISLLLKGIRVNCLAIYLLITYTDSLRMQKWAAK